MRVLMDRLWRWRLPLMLLGVTAVAAVLRFVGLGHPQELVFDELYYARGAYGLLENGYESVFTGDNQAFATGDLSGLTDRPEHVVHPPLGKWMIAVGIKMFGVTPFGWRFMSAVVGTLMVPMVALIGRHLLRSTARGGLAGLFLAVDGQHIVGSRTALLDIFLTFFVVIAFGLLLLDRVRSRRRLFARAEAERERHGPSLAAGARIPGMGPGIGIRWWRHAAVVSLALATGVKWSGLYFAAAFLLLSALWDALDRREAGYAKWLSGAFSRAMVPAGVASVITLPVVYTATWVTWFASGSSYRRDWAENHPDEGLQWLPSAWTSWIEYHVHMLDFHRNLTEANGYSHAYAAHPATWILQLRPTAYYYESWEGQEALDNCGANHCSAAITALGHPLLWGLGAIVLVYAMWRVVRRLDVLALAVVSGTLAGWLPWLFFADRIVFTFYSVSFAPWVMLTVTWGLWRFAKRWPSGPLRPGRLQWVAGFVGMVLLLAGFFWSFWAGQVVPYKYWSAHTWVPNQVLFDDEDGAGGIKIGWV